MISGEEELGYKRRFVSTMMEHLKLDTAEVDGLFELVQVRKFKKGEHLLDQGQVSDRFFFLLEGMVRMYYITSSGTDKSAFFYTENSFVSSFQSYLYGTPSPHAHQALEDSVVIEIRKSSADQMLVALPRFESLARIMLENELVQYQELVSTFISLTPEERYEKMLEDRPELFRRIPQHYIASYLGVSAETLSRIKKRSAEKKRDS